MKASCTVNNLCGKCRKLYPSTAASNDRARRERRGGGGNRSGGRRGRMRDIALETGAAMLEVTGGITGAGTPPTVDQLDGSQQITYSQQQDSIEDASNQRQRHRS